MRKSFSTHTHKKNTTEMIQKEDQKKKRTNFIFWNVTLHAHLAVLNVHVLIGFVLARHKPSTRHGIHLHARCTQRGNQTLTWKLDYNFKWFGMAQETNVLLCTLKCVMQWSEVGRDLFFFFFGYFIFFFLSKQRQRLNSRQRNKKRKTTTQT